MMLIEMTALMDWVQWLPVVFGIGGGFGDSTAFNFAKSNRSSEFGFAPHQRVKAFEFGFPRAQQASDLLFNFARSPVQQPTLSPQLGLLNAPGRNADNLLGRAVDVANARSSGSRAARGQLSPEARRAIIGDVGRQVSLQLAPLSQQAAQFAFAFPAEERLRRAQVGGGGAQPLFAFGQGGSSQGSSFAFGASKAASANVGS